MRKLPWWVKGFSHRTPGLQKICCCNTSSATYELCEITVLQCVPILGVQSRSAKVSFNLDHQMPVLWGRSASVSPDLPLLSSVKLLFYHKKQRQITFSTSNHHSSRSYVADQVTQQQILVGRSAAVSPDLPLRSSVKLPSYHTSNHCFHIKSLLLCQITASMSNDHSTTSYGADQVRQQQIREGDLLLSHLIYHL